MKTFFLHTSLWTPRLEKGVRVEGEGARVVETQEGPKAPFL
jgi:hypothetical protein